MNPRYFADADGRPVLLVGSHHWLVFQHRPFNDDHSDLDFDTYLGCLRHAGHNFIRFWVWEDARNVPLPWQRTGPGLAADGEPRFDLDSLDGTYFRRLRERVERAGKEGFYVGVMLFQGWSVESKHPGRIAWQLHPFRAGNNVNGIDGDFDGDGEGREVHTLSEPRITRIQEAYVRRVVETLNDLDWVLWEISNESYQDSWAWQEHMTRFVRDLEAGMAKRHPLGQTATWPGRTNLAAGSADWISPGTLAGVDFVADPPVADGRKVSIVDSDHQPGRQDGGWVWRSFFRGHHPILMDGMHPPDLEPWIQEARVAMGQARAIAERVDLANMTPSLECASTRYCLKNASDDEYLIYVPEGSVSVDLTGSSGSFRTAWFETSTGAHHLGEPLPGGERPTVRAPATGAFILHLSRTESVAYHGAPGLSRE